MNRCFARRSTFQSFHAQNPPLNQIDYNEGPAQTSRQATRCGENSDRSSDVVYTLQCHAANHVHHLFTFLNHRCCFDNNVNAKQPTGKQITPYLDIW